MTNWADWITHKLDVSHGQNPAMASMEGLRGIAVFMVFWVHYCALIDPWLGSESSGASLQHFLGNAGHIGVDIFFMLSGYLIYGSLLRQQAPQLSSYVWRRVRRIYPAFLAVLGLYLALSFLFPEQSKLPAGLPDALVYIGENILLLPGILHIEPIITVAWSLSYELFFYLTLPLLMHALGLRRWQPRNRILFWIALAVGGEWLYAAMQGGHIRLEMFIAGILLNELHQHRRMALRSYVGGVCLLIAVVLFGALDRLNLPYGLAIAALFVLSIGLGLEALTPGTWAYRRLSQRPLRWLGNMSYSYYLIHGLTLKFGFLILAMLYQPHHDDAWMIYWLWIPFFILTLAPSFALFVLIERPLSLAYRQQQTTR